MQLVQHPGYRAKEWSWSYSRLKNYETCPHRYHQIDVLKKFKDDTTELDEGNRIHKMLEDYIAHDKPLMPQYGHLQYYGDMGKSIIGDIYVEQNLAIDKDFAPCEYFAHNAWYRAKMDVLGINGPVAIGLDWKTGQIKEDPTQLALAAATVFAHWPHIQAIRTEFVWLKYRASSRADILRSDLPKIWAGVLPRVAILKNAHDTNNFPKKPGGLCRNYCAVKSCEHHGGD